MDSSGLVRSNDSRAASSAGLTGATVVPQDDISWSLRSNADASRGTVYASYNPVLKPRPLCDNSNRSIFFTSDDASFGAEVDTLMKSLQAKSKSTTPETISFVEQSGPVDEANSSEAYKKRYRCTADNCGKTFFQKTHLYIHERAHSIKSYLCKEPGCGLSFSQLGNLRTHERRHAGNRLYCCKFCGERFAQHDTLRAHSVVHIFPKPYLCRLDDCGDRFIHLNNLKSHQNNFHIATIRSLSSKLASVKDGGIVDAADKKLWEYFVTLYKKNNESTKREGGGEGRSMFSGDETEFGDKNSGSSTYHKLSGISSEDSSGQATSSISYSTKQTLIDCLMEQFWEVFNPEWSSNFKSCVGHEKAATSPGGATSRSQNSPRSSNLRGQKRKRDGEDDNCSQSNDIDDQPSKQPVDQSMPSKASNQRIALACPYRKRDRRFYSISDFRSCALGHWDSVSRVKEHLYRQHKVPIHCKRCWVEFKSQSDLDEHYAAIEICTMKVGTPVEGVTADIEKRLRSRKKLGPAQSEESRWREVYKILFPDVPDDIIPSPYFDPIYEDLVQSPDSRELVDYEDYCRRELPRLYRSSLEAAVSRGKQPLEEQLRSQLVDMIQNCQDKVFTAYKSKRVRNSDDSVGVLQSTEQSAENALPNARETTSDIISAAFESPPLQMQDQVGLDIKNFRDHGTLFGQPRFEENSLSGSGYATQLCDCFGEDFGFLLCTCAVSNPLPESNDQFSIVNSSSSQFEPNEGLISTQSSPYDLPVSTTGVTMIESLDTISNSTFVQ